MLWLRFSGSAWHTRFWPSLNCLINKITIQENNIWSDSIETVTFFFFFLPTSGIRPSNVVAMSLICNSPSYHIVRKVNVNKTLCKNITSDSVKAIQQITKQSQTVCRLIESFSYVQSTFMTVETVQWFSTQNACSNIYLEFTFFSQIWSNRMFFTAWIHPNICHIQFWD